MQITWNFELTWLLAATIGAIVWATKITVTLDFMAKEIKSIADTVKVLQASYVPDKVFTEKMTEIKGQINALWNKVDNNPCYKCQNFKQKGE